ncbi:hypothetical protein KQ940_00980 [Marinobacterium sp. D7]|uniref:hypothetical protein n=1 Tax=Marinobacterium ramblicola TaxID=2849041 RepID=UPI001C2DA6A4|nr:hypothetical protein [Marinobacterium ramblicola]MBV1786622.1 hypothetical protein [Marinobacterium ramblicola]
MFSKIKVTFVILFCALMAGCAGQIKPMSSDEVSNLSQKRAAVAYFYPDKKINYNELVYKVLWNEYRSNSVSFAGLWDIESELSERFQTRFRQMGINQAVLARDLLNDEQYANLQEDTYTHIRAVLKAIKDGENFPTLTLGASYQKALADQGVDRLVLLGQYPFNIEVFGLTDSEIMRSSADVWVIDTNDGSILFDGAAYINFGHEYEESPREIESNNLHAFKEGIRSAVDKEFAPERLPKQMGFSNPQ